MNTTDSRVTLSWDVGATTALSEVRRARVLERLASRLTDGVLSVTSETERSQLLNRREARDRLAALVNEALVPPKTRRPTKPTKGSQQRRLDAKKARGRTKQLRQERF